MDPDETLREITSLAAVVRDRTRHDTDPDDDDDAVTTLCDLIDALDNWMSHGGYLPAAWRHNREGL